MPMNITDSFHMYKIENFIGNVFYIFNIFAQNIDCGNTLESHWRGDLNEHPQSMFLSKNNGLVFVQRLKNY